MRRLDISGANLSLMDYCTAGPQYASGGFIADSRLPFVINGSQQQWLTRNSEVARLVERRLEPGLLGRRRRSGRRGASRTRRTRRSTRRRSAARSRTSSSTPTALRRARAGGADRHPRHHVGRRRDAGPQHPDHRLLHREARATRSRHDQQRARAGQAPAPHARRLRHRQHASRSSVPTRSCSAWATRRSRPSAVRCRSRSKDAAGHRRRGRHDRRRHRRVARAAAGRQARQRPGEEGRPGQPDHAVATCTSASAARTSARPTPRSW